MMTVYLNKNNNKTKYKVFLPYATLLFLRRGRTDNQKVFKNIPRGIEFKNGLIYAQWILLNIYK